MDTTTNANVWQGTMKVVEEPRLIGSTYQYYWFLVDSKFKGGAKPIIQIETEPLHLVAQDQETSYGRFTSNVYDFSVEGYYKFIPFCWQSIYAQFATS